jgi:hypothetical protein
MEGIERNNSLSEEQQERLAELSDTIKPLIKKLAETGLSSDADAIIDEVDRFKTRLKEQNSGLSDEQVRDYLKEIQGNS